MEGKREQGSGIKAMKERERTEIWALDRSQFRTFSGR